MRFLFTIICIAISGSAFAADTDCLEIPKDSVSKLRLEAASSFNNCLALSAIPNNTPVRFVVLSPDGVTSKVTLYNTAGSGAASYLAEHDSDSDGTSAFLANTASGGVAFRLYPTSHGSKDKGVSISLVIIDSLAQVLIEIHKLESGSPPPSNPPASQCDPLLPWTCNAIEP